MPAAPTLNPTITIVPWADPVIDAVGHDARSPYVERFWLGVLGPTATWLLRRLAIRLEASPDGFELDLTTTAAELGLGPKAGPHSPFARTVARCARFGAVDVVSEGTIRVRRKLPPLTRAQVERLPSHLQVAHHRWTERVAQAHARTVEERREEARGMALSALAQGASPESAERALHQRAIHPALAHEAVAWAHARGPAFALRADQPPPEAA
jgi:hypothetical protein